MDGKIHGLLSRAKALFIKKDEVIKWLILLVFIFSFISLIVMLRSDYIGEEIFYRGVPLAIVSGLNAIAAAIIFKRDR
ncbi:hypothetical protein LJC13_01250 [Peptostreptococcaceae bacterium OttesenSCG-928-C18]|nr:hypothetical protein [Peptostreptococcaceae bacterium OttesenSCG-928-C18]